MAALRIFLQAHLVSSAPVQEVPLPVAQKVELVSFRDTISAADARAQASWFVGCQGCLPQEALPSASTSVEVLVAEKSCRRGAGLGCLESVPPAPANSAGINPSMPDPCQLLSSKRGFCDSFNPLSISCWRGSVSDLIATRQTTVMQTVCSAGMSNCPGA